MAITNAIDTGTSMSLSAINLKLTGSLSEMNAICERLTYSESVCGMATPRPGVTNPVGNTFSRSKTCPQ